MQLCADINIIIMVLCRVSSPWIFLIEVYDFLYYVISEFYEKLTYDCNKFEIVLVSMLYISILLRKYSSKIRDGNYFAVFITVHKITKSIFITLEKCFNSCWCVHQLFAWLIGIFLVQRPWNWRWANADLSDSHVWGYWKLDSRVV